MILLKDVQSLGKKETIVNVSNGYARNMLLPKKLGIEATPKNLHDLKRQKAHDTKLAREMLETAREFGYRISKSEITILVKVGEGGRVFGSISAKKIAEAEKEQLGFALDKKKLQMDGPIKELGTETVSVKLHPQVTAQLKVHVKEV